MNIKKHIPNFLTCCNLLCGVVGIFYLFEGDFWIASYSIYIACVFDFLDGFAARMLKVSSPIGKELDSLADMVTFGVLPGFIMFKAIRFIEHNFSYANAEPMSVTDAVNISQYGYWSFIAFLIPVFSALRLAKFNIDTRQSDSFIGLPTPANALFISSVPYFLTYVLMLTNNENEQNFYNKVAIGILCVTSIILSYLLVAELPLIALKFKNFGWPDNKMRYLLIISAVVLLLILNIKAIPLIIILYIILSLTNNYFNKSTSAKV